MYSGYKKMRWVVAILLVGIFAVWFLYKLITFPDYERFKYEYFRSSEGVVLDRNLYPIAEVRKDFGFRKFGYVKLDYVNKNFLNMLIQSEDKRFYSHIGVDIISSLSALSDFIKNGRRRGASTIDMQFIRNLFNLKNESVFIRKLKEIFYSFVLEIKWDKQEILEAYINTVPIRGEIQGIYTGAQILFEKSPEFLNNEESLILLSLIKKPASGSEEIYKNSMRIKKRLGLLIDEKLFRATIDGMKDKNTASFNYTYLPVLSQRLLMNRNSPVITTIDLDIQKKALEILKSFVVELKGRNLNDAALLVVDNKSGEILSYVANSTEYSQARYVDGVIAKRQAGSTLKPFLYEYAFEKRLLTPASVLNDAPIYLSKKIGIYSPQNYDRRFIGPVSARVALASSLNIPAIRVIGIVGVENFTNRLSRLGFDVSRAGEIDDYFGESLALGSLDVSLYELTRAYLMLASDGLYREPRLIRGVETIRQEQILDRGAVFLIKSILSDRDARSVTFELENTLSTPFYSVAKTGTSKDMRDNWCIGFSDRYTVGVWTGNFSGEPMYDVSGSHGASQIWFALMKELHREKSSTPPSMPENIVKKAIRYSTDIEPPRNEYFIEGTEPSDEIIGVSVISEPKILYPPDNSIFAYDPGIPETQQKLFVYTGCNECYILYDTQKRLSIRRGVSMVDLEKGSHTIRLVDKAEMVIDSINYEVR